MGLMNHAKSRWKIVYDSKNYPLISKFMHLIVAVNFFNTLQFILSELNLKWYSYNKLEKPPFSSLSSFLFWTLFVSAHKHEYLARIYSDHTAQTEKNGVYSIRMRQRLTHCTKCVAYGVYTASELGLG